MLQSELCGHVSEMRPSYFGENVKPISISVKICKGSKACTTETTALVTVKLKSIYIMWQKRKASQWLKGTPCVYMSSFCTRNIWWSDFVWICHSPPALPFIYLYPLSLHASPAPSFILPSSITLPLYSCVIPSIHSTLPLGVRGWLPVLTASYLTFSPLLWSNRRPSHTKSYRPTLPPADSSTSGRGWLHLQTSGHNGLVHPAMSR